jgi:hypothetical protein
MPVRVSDGEFRILAYLCDKANGKGEEIYRSYERLAHWTGLRQEYVGHVVRQFKLRGWLHEYSRAGFPRWRLDLPGLVLQRSSDREGHCAKPVDDLLTGLPPADPGIGSTDPAIGSADPRIVEHSTKPAPRLQVTDTTIVSPSCTSCTSVPSEEQEGGADAPLSPGRLQFQMLKARLEAQRAAIAATPRPRRRRR